MKRQDRWARFLHSSAPKAEQVALAGFLDDVEAVAEFRRTMNHDAEIRLNALYEGFARLKDDGYPVDCIQPQGAVFLSLRLDWLGKRGSWPVWRNTAINEERAMVTEEL